MSEVLSLGTIRRWLRPVMKACLARRLARTHDVQIDGLSLTVPPTVFHPKYFGTTCILGRYIARLELRGKTLLDMGTGSGLIALRAAKVGARVTAVDVNPAAVDAALRNAATNHLAIDAICGDLFDRLSALKFDVIVWNPPFFRGEPKSMAEQGFWGGPNLETIRRFASELADHLSEGGAAYLVLSADAEIDVIRGMFVGAGLTFNTVHRQWWGLGEEIIIADIHDRRRTAGTRSFPGSLRKDSIC